MTDWNVLRIKTSYVYVTNYMNRNYPWPKRMLGRELLKLVRKSPGKVDYLLRAMAYVALGSAMVYGLGVNGLNYMRL